MSRWDGLTYEDRFWSRVDKSDDCWLWTRGRNGVGYGMYDAPNKVLAHRYSYEATVGPIPPGHELDHRPTCPKHCVNPDHLTLATHKQNQENRAGGTTKNTSGFRGVSWWSARQCWKGTVVHNGKACHVGYFSDPAEANAAVVAMRNRLFTHNQLDRAGA